ncbi:hypothetical protein [Micromonospora sp. NPDC005806]
MRARTVGPLADQLATIDLGRDRLAALITGRMAGAGALVIPGTAP